MEMEKLMQALTAWHRNDEGHNYFATRTFHLTVAEFDEQLPSLLDQSGLRSWYDNELFYSYIHLSGRYTIMPVKSTTSEGMCEYASQMIHKEVVRLQMRMEKAVAKFEEARLYKGLNRIICRNGVITVGGDSKYPSRIWGAVGQYPAIVDVICSGELDKEDTLIIIEIAKTPLESKGDDWDQTASINCWRFDKDTGSIVRSPGDGRFRKADGTAGPCQFELTVSDFLPLAESCAETDAMAIEFDMDRMRERLREDEAAHHDLRRLDLPEGPELAVVDREDRDWEMEESPDSEHSQ
ncbi:hypothetical protein LTR56_006018 [Elasticomyces elasticus]|nr:hypothetical protein LTR56_006018 [Elasticomyces elasticus]KAK3669021.1 hypothetical protein LTR22_000100 [Elasticomyces elasticus]KAK4922680.1 hypothetical protein LTR49_010036 [Elasticomyces elasticus]KAK5760935.1 hypothetical protein LTS12_008939 [Elasticomyces elasticus]